MKIVIKTAPSRPKPKAGDERIIKGVPMVRQRLRTSEGSYVVSNGKPVFEWVEKGCA